nr:MAG TPA: hypothetical protein [Caudoviricetes sp.]
MYRLVSLACSFFLCFCLCLSVTTYSISDLS